MSTDPTPFTYEPFGPSANPAAYVALAGCERARAAMEAAMDAGRVAALVGPPGHGKTTLLRMVGGREQERARIAYVPFSTLTPEDLCAIVLNELGAQRNGAAPRDALLALAEEMVPRGGIVLLIDDAQAMPIETARALTGLLDEARGALRLALTAVASPEAEEVCAAFGERIDVVRLEQGLTASETQTYVETRLAYAGARPDLVAAFDDETIGELHQASQGVPRKLNQVAEALVRRVAPSAMPKLRDLTEGPNALPRPATPPPPVQMARPPAPTAPTEAEELARVPAPPVIVPVPTPATNGDASNAAEPHAANGNGAPAGWRPQQPAVPDEVDAPNEPVAAQEAAAAPARSEPAQPTAPVSVVVTAAPEPQPELEVDPDPDPEPALEVDPEPVAPQVEAEATPDPPPRTSRLVSIARSRTRDQDNAGDATEEPSILIDDPTPPAPETAPTPTNGAATNGKWGIPEDHPPPMLAGRVIPDPFPPELPRRRVPRAGEKRAPTPAPEPPVVEAAAPVAPPEPEANEAPETPLAELPTPEASGAYRYARPRAAEPVEDSAPIAIPVDAAAAVEPTPVTDAPDVDATLEIPVDDSREAAAVEALREFAETGAGRLVQQPDLTEIVEPFPPLPGQERERDPFGGPVATAFHWLRWPALAVGVSLALAWMTTSEPPTPLPMPDPPTPRVAGPERAAAPLPGGSFRPPPATATVVSVAINATPWAIIEIDGRELGETPLAGVPIEMGPHSFRAHMPDGSVREQMVYISPENNTLVFE